MLFIYSRHKYLAIFCMPVLFISLLSCGGSGGGGGDSDPGADPAYSWINISPYGGFIPSIAFNPDNHEIWLSGDDASGLYKKRDSSSAWVLIDSVPENWSTYSLVFDPGNSGIVYAPSHFGRGLIKSEDGGSSWQEIGSGLPTTLDAKRINDFAIHPADSTILFACTDGGIYKSVDAGQIFTKITSSVFDGYEAFNAMVVSDENPPKIIIANSKGGVYISTNEGDDWTAIVEAAPNGLSISDLAVTGNALYVGYYLGVIGKTTNFSGSAGYGTINDPTASGEIESGYSTRIAAVSGASEASDLLYIGTVHLAGSTKWGFHVSRDGGASFTRRVDGLEDNSIFSMAVNPNDQDHVVVGTFNGGVYVTTDAGLNWSGDHGRVYATDSFGFAEDPNDGDHIIFSSSAGIQGTSKVYETFSGGAAWSRVASLDDLNIMSLHIDIDSPSIILAGTFRNGLYRSVNGSSGPWTRVIANPYSIREVECDSVDTSILYAITDDMVVEPNPGYTGLYYSDDKGVSWNRRVDFALNDIKPHPENGGEAVAAGPDAFATTDGFTTMNSLGLSAHAPGRFFTSIAFDPQNPETVLVGTSTGELYLTEDYSSGGGCAWEEIANPSRSILIEDIEIVNRGDSQAWYLLCWIGDIQTQPDSTPGILYSSDRGGTWTFLDQGLYPSQLTWKMKKSRFDNATFYVGMWGGGFMRLDDPR